MAYGNTASTVDHQFASGGSSAIQGINPKDVAENRPDTLRFFRERTDFMLSLYPNHLYFSDASPVAESSECTISGDAWFSQHDRKMAQRIAFAAEVFYTAGRAVPWFLSVVYPLKIQSTRFLSDFAEWQYCNNCHFATGFDPEVADHRDIERMQLTFLELKYEERHLASLLPAVCDIVRLNGAFARAAAEGVQTQLALSYDPEDLFSPDSMDIKAFVENVCMAPCAVTVVAGQPEPYWEYCSSSMGRDTTI
jgi:hypothetical protein